MSNSTIYVLFLLLNSYVLRRCCYLQGVYTKISLKNTELHKYGDSAETLRSYVIEK